MRIPTLNIKILLESNPLESRILARRLAVAWARPSLPPRGAPRTFAKGTSWVSRGNEGGRPRLGAAPERAGWSAGPGARRARSGCLPCFLAAWLPACLSGCLSIHRSTRLPIHLYACLPIHPSIYLAIYLSAYCTHVRMDLSLPPYMHLHYT